MFWDYESAKAFTEMTSQPGDRTGICGARCSHGGVCTKDTGHDGQHSASGYCQWSDSDSISVEESDNMFISKVLRGNN